MDIDEVSGHVVSAAIKVHSARGPGLLEGAYEACMTLELRQRGLQVDRQVSMPIVYCEQRIDVGYRIDLLVERQVVVEEKVVTKVLTPVAKRKHRSSVANV